MKDILVLAYAISPSKGSEYAVAWNYVTAMSRYHRLTVLYGTSGEHMGDTVEMSVIFGSILCLMLLSWRLLRVGLPNGSMRSTSEGFSSIRFISLIGSGTSQFIVRQESWFEKNILI